MTWGGVIDNIELIDLGAGYDVILGHHSRDRIDFSNTELRGVELIDAADGPDIIRASQGDDTIRSGSGNNTVDGQGGNDTLLFDADFADYTLSNEADGAIRIQRSDGWDIARNIEILQFADGIYQNGEFLSFNQAPVAQDDSTITSAGKAVVIDVLANDSDPDDDVLSISEIGVAANGSVVLNDDGTLTYAPSEGFVGNDSFEYTVSDPHGSIAQATVNVSVLLATETIIGTAARDIIDLSTRTDITAIIDGAGGHDVIQASPNDDIIIGGAGQDKLSGQGGDDIFIYEGQGNQFDTLIDGGDGFDIIRGSDADDMVGTWANSIQNIELIDLGAGHDVILGHYGRDVMDFTNVELRGVELIDGAHGHDVIRGSQDADLIIGGAGQDNLSGQGGDDIFIYEGQNNHNDTRIDGGDGFDIIRGSEADDMVGVWGDAIKNIELIDLGAGHDVIFGHRVRDVIDFSNVELHGVERIDGAGGDDFIRGSQADDVILGGAGRNVLYGEEGADIFIYEAASAYDTTDIIRDFSMEQGDALDIRDLLSNYDPLVDTLTDFLQLADNGSTLLLNIDADGGADSFHSVVELNTIESFDLATMLEQEGLFI